MDNMLSYSYLCIQTPTLFVFRVCFRSPYLFIAIQIEEEKLQISKRKGKDLKEWGTDEIGEEEEGELCWFGQRSWGRLTPKSFEATVFWLFFLLYNFVVQFFALDGLNIYTFDNDFILVDIIYLISYNFCRRWILQCFIYWGVLKSKIMAVWTGPDRYLNLERITK